MTDALNPNPVPDSRLRFESGADRWRARYNNHVIADTDEAVVLREADLPPVVYFPRETVSMEYMSRSDTTSHCPYKGDATYYTLMMNGILTEDAAWSYETPYDTADAIAGRIAFYPDRVEIYQVDQAALDAGKRQVNEVVLHTDAGDGTTQEQSWRPDRI
jgi:uncharacterized protein (DUF427 family)